MKDLMQQITEAVETANSVDALLRVAGEPDHVFRYDQSAAVIAQYSFQTRWHPLELVCQQWANGRITFSVFDHSCHDGES